MIIRKLFKFEGAHRVYNCSSKRCKYSEHGHSYVVEVKLTSEGLDNGKMIVDFGLLKGTIKDLIDSFDHAYSMWTKMPNNQKDFFKEHSARYIELPDSPSAEAYSLMFTYLIDKILNATEFNNGEKSPRLYSVIVHETDTGYAESFIDDLKYVDYQLEDFIFSDDIIEEWIDSEMFDKLIKYTNNGGDKPFKNEVVEQQV